MKYRKLGRTETEVSVICLGCGPFGGDETCGGQGEGNSLAVIRASLDAGVNFFDTAEIYGNGASEEFLGRALAGMRDRVVIASKASPANLAPAKIKSACEGSLRRLRTDYIDLYQIHWPNPDVPVADTLGAMEELKAQGKIRRIGVSNFGVSYLAELLAAGRTEGNQLCYNLLWRAIEYEIQPACVENDISILCYSPMCQGLLTGKFSSAKVVPDSRAMTRLFSSKNRPASEHDEPGCEDEVFRAIDEIRRTCLRIGTPMGQAALGWLLEQRGVTSVIAGARNAEQAAENARAADIELPADAIEELSAATQRVKAHIGANADPGRSESRMERRGN